LTINLNNETDAYYHDALDSIFREIDLKAYLTVARWSYVLGTNNPLLFNPQSVGKMDEAQSDCIHREFSREEFKDALKSFSFTRLLVENDRELWFHFTNEHAPQEGEEQTYLRSVKFGSRTVQVLEIAAERVTDGLVAQIIEKFVTSQPEEESPAAPEKGARVEESLRESGERRLSEEALKMLERLPPDGEPSYYKTKLDELRKKREEIKTTLNAVIFSLFQSKNCNIKHIYFMPIVIAAGAERTPSGFKRVVGIVSINSLEQITINLLALVLQPAVQSIMAPFHFLEMDDQRRMFSLRSAIAAIMSRNMSHNIGSHVLWHLAQELK